jgi:hypothetical protein
MLRNTQNITAFLNVKSYLNNRYIENVKINNKIKDLFLLQGQRQKLRLIMLTNYLLT